jgi:microcystin-dependent protein
MPRNGLGVYSLPAGYEAVTGQAATASQHNTPLEDIASEITASVPVDGSKAMTGNLAMGENKITGMADGSASTDGATMGNLAIYMPPGVIVPYGGTTEPTGWLFCYGQAISRTTYADLFTAISTTYGAGDGSLTFNLPDLRGRVVAGQDDMGGTSANRLTSPINGDTLGAAGGAESVTLIQSNLPNVTLSGTTSSNGAHTHTVTSANVAGSMDEVGSGAQEFTSATNTTSSNGDHTHTITTNSINGNVTQTAHANVQPTIILNYIIRT